MNIKDTKMCFGCGKENEFGLQLEFSLTKGKAMAEFTLKPRFQGWNDIAHGGIVATILDEAMAWAIKSFTIKAVTAEMNVKYKKPTPIGKPLKVIGNVLKSKGRAIFTKAKIMDEDEILATATATYIKINGRDLNEEND